MKRLNLKKFAILLVVIGLTITSCSSQDDGGSTNTNNDCISGVTITGEGPVVMQTLTLSSFNGINASGRANITITQGATQEITATGQANIIEAITTTVSNNIWNIGLEGPCNYSYDELFINITIPNINSIQSSGMNAIVINDFNGQSNLDIDLSGSGSFILNGFEGITQLDVALTGSGTFMANEDITTLSTLNINQSGNFEYSGFNISVDDCSINTSGSGTTEVTAQNTLNVTITGSAIVRYKGGPTIIQNITGSGQLIDAN